MCLCVCVYPTVEALAVGAGSSEVDVRVLADLIQGLDLAGYAFQIHHGNMATLDKHLSHTHTQNLRMKQHQYLKIEIPAITHRCEFSCCWLVVDE